MNSSTEEAAEKKGLSDKVWTGVSHMVSHEDRIRVVHKTRFRGINIRYTVIGENRAGVFPGTWFFFDVDPLPDYEDLIKITADIIDGVDGYECGPDGRLRHRENCPGSHRLDETLTRAVVSLKPRIYRIGLWLGDEYNKVPPGFTGYPVVLPVNFDISRLAFPGHNHLVKYFSAKSYHMPESICHSGLLEGIVAEKDIVRRISDVIGWTCLWLLKHRIYEADPAGGILWKGNEAVETVDREYIEELEAKKKKLRRITREISKMSNGRKEAGVPAGMTI
ncbi:MAG: hypothetical protein R6W99_07245 [Clostridia bacterium]